MADTLDVPTQKRVITELMDQVDELQVENSALKAVSEPSSLPPGVIPNTAPFATLNCKVAWSALTKKEKLYAYHLCQASWEGAKIVLVQTSFEAPIIFVMLIRAFSGQPLSELRAKCTSAGVSDYDFDAAMIYAAGFFGNMGNYQSFGDSKILPGLPSETFKTILECSTAASDGAKGVEEGSIVSLFDECSALMYSTDKCSELGFPPDAYTAYFSHNCTKQDADLAQSFLNGWKEDSGYNTRLFKTAGGGVGGQDLLSVRLASADEGVEVEAHDTGDGVSLEVRKGDYSPIMARVATSLDAAGTHAANEEQKAMLTDYSSSFRGGDIDKHKVGTH
jgi:dipeptidyl-peptidase-3